MDLDELYLLVANGPERKSCAGKRLCREIALISEDHNHSTRSLTIPGLTIFMVVVSLGISIPVLGGGKVYTRSQEAPRPSKTPLKVDLKLAEGALDSGINVSAYLAETRLNQSSSRGGAGMTGRLSTFQKYIQLDIGGLSKIADASRLTVNYAVQEGPGLSWKEDNVELSGSSPNIFVETEGFTDESGTEVSTMGGTVITSTKTKHFEADIIAVSITILDSKNQKLFSGSWPNTPADKVTVPARMLPRTFTASDGRSISGRLVSFSQESIVIEVNKKQFTVSISSLSEDDKKFITTVIDGKGTVPTIAMKKPSVDNAPAAAPETKSPPVMPSPVVSTGGDSRYQFVRESLKWTAASQKAIAMGGHLATITSREENSEVLKVIPEDCDSAWIGGTKAGREDWTWVTGEPWGFTAWAENENGGRGEPSGTGPGGLPEDFLEFARPGYRKPGGWNDSRERSFWHGENQGFVVEFEDR